LRARVDTFHLSKVAVDRSRRSLVGGLVGQHDIVDARLSRDACIGRQRRPGWSIPAFH
jgi:hypothetical protein